MNIHITIDAPTAGEARAAMAELLDTSLIFAEPDKVKVVSTFEPETGEKTAETVADIASPTEAPKRARKTKAKDESTPAAPPATETTAADSVEDQKQDAADEQAETDAAKAANGGKLTLDDVRNALGDYVKAYGMQAAQADGPVLIARVLGVDVDPAKPKKISDLGDDQALLKRAVEGVAEMIAKNPFSRTAVTP